MSQIVTTQIRTFELVETVTGLLEGTITDWPAQIQDAVYGALEVIATRERLPLVIVASYCAIDHDVADGTIGRFYVRVIASEIVMADARYLDPRLYSKTPDGETLH